MIYDILPVNNYKGNGFNNTFDFDFYIESADQLKVYLFDEDGIKHELKLNIDYSINEIKNDNGSYITFPLDGSSFRILGENQNISLELDLPFCQETQYNNSSLLNLRSLEYSFDYLTRLIQILKRKLDLCVKVDECSSITPKELIESINEANNNAKINANSAIEANNSILNIKKDILSSEENIKNTKNEIDLTKNDIVQIASDFESTADSKANITLDNVLPSDEFKSNSILWSMPDYSAGIELSDSSFPYTAPADGVIDIAINACGNTKKLYINDITVSHAYASNNNYYAMISGQYRVKKGDVVTYGASNLQWAAFFPMKGVNND